MTQEVPCISLQGRPCSWDYMKLSNSSRAPRILTNASIHDVRPSLQRLFGEDNVDRQGRQVAAHSRVQDHLGDFNVGRGVCFRIRNLPTSVSRQCSSLC